MRITNIEKVILGMTFICVLYLFFTIPATYKALTKTVSADDYISLSNKCKSAGGVAEPITSIVTGPATIGVTCKHNNGYIEVMEVP